MLFSAILGLPLGVRSTLTKLARILLLRRREGSWFVASLGERPRGDGEIADAAASAEDCLFSKMERRLRTPEEERFSEADMAVGGGVWVSICDTTSIG